MVSLPRPTTHPDNAERWRMRCKELMRLQTQTATKLGFKTDIGLLMQGNLHPVHMEFVAARA